MTDTTLTSPEGRYSLADDGQIFWQKDSTNPLPGEAVGKIGKGASILAPAAFAADHPKAQEWLDIHVRTVLEPLFVLKQEEGAGALTGAAKDIGARLYDHLGVMNRSDLEDVIPGLDPELRKGLRSKGVRLGPILAFVPALVKPAAIRMRAMLWAIWNDKTLPIARPLDGRVSEVVDPETIDRDFYRMIGYPVFGPRAIRIDMLDRVITDVYDAAQEGIFEAKHKYAEWLGCNLDSLHAVLESMGHRKMKPEVAPPTLVSEQTEAAVAEASAAETPAIDAPEVAEPVAEMLATAKPAPVVVKFMLKRGKMSDRPQAKRPEHKRPERKAKPKKAFDPNKPQLLTEEDKERIRARDEERQKQKDARSKDRDRNRDGGRDRDRDERPHKPRGKNERTPSNEGRVYTFEGQKKDGDDDGNPFAILKNLKK